MGGSDGVAHSVLVTSRSAADVRAVNLDAAPFSSSRTCEPATAAPPCDSFPETRTVRFFLFVTRALSVTVPEDASARVSTVPAAFGTPVLGAYGVVIAFQTLSAAGTWNTWFTVK